LKIWIPDQVRDDKRDEEEIFRYFDKLSTGKLPAPFYSGEASGVTDGEFDFLKYKKFVIGN
jgi:hypothetical protein